jgi:hypothetical protein
MTEPIDQMRAQRGNALRQQLAGLLLSTGAVGLGAGAFGRFLGGGVSNARKQLRPHSTYTPNAPLVVRVPVPPDDEKQAADAAAPAKSPYSAAASFFGGDNARSVHEMPLAIPAFAATLAGGLYGGWRMADNIVDSTRKRQLDRELARVRARYNRALGMPTDEKQASVTEPGLERVYQRWKAADSTALEKTAINADDYLGPVGAVVGSVGAPLLAVGGTSAALAYALARRRGVHSIVSRARREYENDMQRLRPPAVLAIPQPAARVGEDDDRG